MRFYRCLAPEHLPVYVCQSGYIPTAYRQGHSWSQRSKGKRELFFSTHMSICRKRGQLYSLQAVLLKPRLPVNLAFFPPWSFNFLPQRFLHLSFLQTSGNRLKLISSDASESAGLAALQSAFRCHFGIKIYHFSPIVCKRNLGEGLCMRLKCSAM